MAPKTERTEICKRARAARKAGTARKYPKTINGVNRLVWDMIEAIRLDLKNEEIKKSEAYALIATFTSQLTKLYQFKISNQQKAEIETKLDRVLKLINGDTRRKAPNKNQETPAIKINTASAILVPATAETPQENQNEPA